MIGDYSSSGSGCFSFSTRKESEEDWGRLMDSYGISDVEKDYVAVGNAVSKLEKDERNYTFPGGPFKNHIKDLRLEYEKMKIEKAINDGLFNKCSWRLFAWPNRCFLLSETQAKQLYFIFENESFYGIGGERCWFNLEDASYQNSRGVWMELFKVKISGNAKSLSAFINKCNLKVIRSIEAKENVEEIINSIEDNQDILELINNKTIL